MKNTHVILAANYPFAALGDPAATSPSLHHHFNLRLNIPPISLTECLPDILSVFDSLLAANRAGNPRSGAPEIAHHAIHVNVEKCRIGVSTWPIVMRVTRFNRTFRMKSSSTGSVVWRLFLRSKALPSL